MPFWRRNKRPGLVLGAAAMLSLAAAAAGAQQNAEPKSGRRVNELTLSGLRPGRDTRAAALARYHKPWGARDEKTATWRDLCRGREVRLEFGEADAVESITVAVTTGPHYDCSPGTPRMPAEAWKTGRGLALGDTRERVATLYGEPDSHGPSTKQGDESEFYYYAFDWAGSDVPQVLEVTCDKKTGRVVQITLAAQSL
jgi:hypothetical protein